MSLIKKVTLPLLISSALWSQFSAAAPVTYEMDTGHTSVVVSWNHFGFSNPTADLSGITGNIDFDASKVSDSKVDVTIPLNSIDTHVDKLTQEFKGAEYFDVTKYPNATFKSTKVVSTGKNTLDVHGDLTIKGIAKPVVLHAVLNKQGMHPMVKKEAVGFNATTTFKRSDFKLDKYVPAVSDDVKLTITTEAYAK